MPRPRSVAIRAPRTAIVARRPRPSPRSSGTDTFDPARHLLLVADDITRLRRVDVERLLVDGALETWEKRQVMADWVRTQRPDLAEEVADVLAESDLAPAA